MLEIIQSKYNIKKGYNVTYLCILCILFPEVSISACFWTYIPRDTHSQSIQISRPNNNNYLNESARTIWPKIGPNWIKKQTANTYSNLSISLTFPHIKSNRDNLIRSLSYRMSAIMISISCPYSAHSGAQCENSSSSKFSLKFSRCKKVFENLY